MFALGGGGATNGTLVIVVEKGWGRLKLTGEGHLEVSRSGWKDFDEVEGFEGG
jgi:hypothetical protein